MTTSSFNDAESTSEGSHAQVNAPKSTTSKPKQFRFNSFDKEYNLIKEIAAMFPYNYPNQVTQKFSEIGEFIGAKYSQTVTGVSCQRCFLKMIDEFKSSEGKKRWESGVGGDYTEFNQLLQECCDLYDAHLALKAQTKENKDKELEKIREDESIAKKMLKDATKTFKDKVNAPESDNGKNRRTRTSSTTSEVIDLTNLEQCERDKIELERERIVIDRKRLKLEEERVKVDMKREENKEKEMDMMREIFQAYKEMK